MLTRLDSLLKSNKLHQLSGTWVNPCGYTVLSSLQMSISPADISLQGYRRLHLRPLCELSQAPDSFIPLISLGMTSSNPLMVSQIARLTSFYGWLIFYCVYISHFLYPFIHQWTLRLLPCSVWQRTWGCMYIFKVVLSFL